MSFCEKINLIEVTCWKPIQVVSWMLALWSCQENMREVKHSRFQVVVARSTSDVLKLQSDVIGLLKQTGREDHLDLTPAYFLAWIQKKRARPFVLAVFDSQGIAGIVYCFKRCLWNVPVGLVTCGDKCGDTSVIAREECFREVVRAALEIILREKFIFLIRIGWNIEVSSAPWKALDEQHADWMPLQESQSDVWNHLSLARTYELFLAKLGPQTRRNMRYYRRRGEQEEWVFENDIPFENAVTAFQTLYPHQLVGETSRTDMDRYIEMLRSVPGSFFSGLRTKDGRWIAIIGGWMNQTRMFVILQFNNSAYAQASVSAVLRGYVIESAIESGIQGVKFIDGCKGILRKYTCSPSQHLLMRRNGYLAQLAQRVICQRFPWPAMTRLIEVARSTVNRADLPKAAV